MKELAALVLDDRATTLVEYGVLMASFSFLAIGGLLLVSSSANNLLQNMFTQAANIELCPPGTTGC